MTRLGPLVVAALAVAACGQRSREAAGLAGWNVGRAKLGDVKEGRCDPTDLPGGRKGVWCFGGPGVTMGRQPASVHLYFSDGSATGGGVGSSGNMASPMIELQLRVRTCDVASVDRYLRDRLGVPAESRRGRSSWETRFLLAHARLPDTDGACLVRLFPPAERAEFDRVRAEPSTP